MEMTFAQMRDLLIKHFNKITKNAEHIFAVTLDKDKLYDLYLDSFPEGKNEIYRERRHYDCSCCRHFIKSIGNAVVIKNGEITTIWDFETNDDTFAPVLAALSAFVKKHAVSDVFLSVDKKIGKDHNFDDKTTQRWDHFYLELDNKFVCSNGLRHGEILNRYRTAKDVFKRSLDELTLDSLDTVLDLISTNTLYKGPEWKDALTTFRKHKIAYDKLTSNKAKDLYAWEHSVTLPESISKLRNTSMGTFNFPIS